MIELLSGPSGPILIFLLRILDVSMGTLRIVYVTRGERLVASLVGFAEVLVWITAVGSTIMNLTSPLHVIGYCAGFATGTWAGVWLESKVPIGVATVQAFTSEAGSGVAASLRSLGLGVTQVRGEGLEGPVDIVSTVVKRRLVPQVIQTVEIEDPDAFITVYEARVRRGQFPGLMRK